MFSSELLSQNSIDKVACKQQKCISLPSLPLPKVPPPPHTITLEVKVSTNELRGNGVGWGGGEAINIPFILIAMFKDPEEEKTMTQVKAKPVWLDHRKEGR